MTPRFSFTVAAASVPSVRVVTADRIGALCQQQLTRQVLFDAVGSAGT